MQLQIFRTAQQLFEKEGQTFKSLCVDFLGSQFFYKFGAAARSVHKSCWLCGPQELVYVAGCVVHKSLRTLATVRNSCVPVDTLATVNSTFCSGHAGDGTQPRWRLQIHVRQCGHVGTSEIHVSKACKS